MWLTAPPAISVRRGRAFPGHQFSISPFVANRPNPSKIGAGTYLCYILAPGVRMRDHGRARRAPDKSGTRTGQPARFWVLSRWRYFCVWFS